MLSIIIPVKNQLFYTKSIYNEIRNKCPYEYEIIFINDNSTDKTWEFLASIESDNVKIVTQIESIWVNKARNIGVSIAKNDLCLIINNDIVFTSDTIQNLVEKADRENYKVIWPVSTHNSNKWELPVFIKEDNICWWCYLIRKQDNIFPIPEELVLRYWDDRIYHKIGKKPQRVGEALVHHYESRTLNQSTEIRRRVDKTIATDKIEWYKIKEKEWR